MQREAGLTRRLMRCLRVGPPRAEGGSVLPLRYFPKRSAMASCQKSDTSLV